jgi:hypothetical protein
MRVAVDWRSSSKDNYKDFCKKNPTIKITYDLWRQIVYAYNDSIRTYILETGEKARIPGGFGEITINKKKRKRIKVRPQDGREFINLPVDWKKTKEKGKIIYNFNYHTEGYYFGWLWIRTGARFKDHDLWYFKPSRVTSRLITHYINIDEKYQHTYQNWKL